MEDRVREAPAHPFPTTVVTHFTPSRPPGSLVSTVCLLSWGLSPILLREGPLPPVHAPLTPNPGLGVPVVANKRMLNESINESSPERPSPLTLHSQDQLASSELHMSASSPSTSPHTCPPRPPAHFLLLVQLLPNLNRTLHYPGVPPFLHLCHSPTEFVIVICRGPVGFTYSLHSRPCHPSLDFVNASCLITSL